ncbi:hypothetical protein HYDPIDRAFT_110397 [Hydnomerulius pinastri MD-312]|nr:hypothetical protein HYDPIDRAFT_110397 [Hydnomerulius pinastri MD-312]
MEAELREANAKMEAELREANAKVEAELRHMEMGRAKDQVRLMDLEDAKTKAEAEMSQLQKAKTKAEAESLERLEANMKTEAELVKLRQDQVKGDARVTELAQSHNELSIALDELCKLTAELIPLRLRLLLDLARKKVLELLNQESWDDMRGGRTSSQLVSYLDDELKHHNLFSSLSWDALEFLCSYNRVRREGNRAAHQATQANIRDAIMSCDTGRPQLEEIYKFRFGESVYDDTRDARLSL